MAVAEIGDDDPLIALGGDVANHLSRLGRPVEAVGLTRRGVQLEYPVPVEIAHFDFVDEEDMVAKMRTAAATSPIVSAIFANSSLSEGKLNGFAYL